MLQQLKALRDEKFQGHYVLDAVRLKDHGEEEEEPGRRAFAVSRFNRFNVAGKAYALPGLTG